MSKSIYTLLVEKLETPRWSDCYTVFKYLREQAHS